MRIVAALALALCAASASAATCQAIDTRSTTINVAGVTNFNPGFGPTAGFTVTAPSLLGLPNGTILGAPRSPSTSIPWSW